MDTIHDSREVLAFFKAFAHLERLKIAGHLARRPGSVAELAAALDMQPAAIFAHLQKLQTTGLVDCEQDANRQIYTLSSAALEAMARRNLAGRRQQEFPVSQPMDPEDREAVGRYTWPDGRLKLLPSEARSPQVILAYLARAFDCDRKYSQIQVNEELARFHPDVATLRRYLVEDGYLARTADGRAYWRPTGEHDAID